MATFSGSYNIQNPVAMVKTWHDGLAAMGWVRTEDTGQIDEDADPVPTETGFTLWGRSFWTPGDGLGGIVLRLDFTVRYSTAPYGSVEAFVGAATNGAGALTGEVWASQSRNTPSGNGDAMTELLMGGDQSGFFAAMGADLDGSGSGNPYDIGRYVLLVDRCRTAEGAPHPEGAAFLVAGPSSNTSNLSVGIPGEANYNRSRPSSAFSLFPIMTGAMPTGEYGASYSPDSSSTAVFPLIFGGPGIPTWVSPLMVGVAPSDQPPGLSAEIAGRSRYYRKTRAGAYGTSGVSPGPISSISYAAGSPRFWPMMLWED